MSEPFEDAINMARGFRKQMELVRKAIRLSVDDTEGETWERTTSEAESEPTEEPDLGWEQKRLEEIREQMRLRWPTAPRPLKRRPLPIR